MIDASKSDFWEEPIILELQTFVLMADREAKFTLYNTIPWCDNFIWTKTKQKNKANSGYTAPAGHH